MKRQKLFILFVPALFMLALIGGAILDASLQRAGAQDSTATARRIVKYSSAPFTCDAAHEGWVYQNTTAHTLNFCNGTGWTSAGGTVLTDSASLRSALSDETGTGAAVFGTSPTLVTPTLGVASSTSESVTGTGGAGYFGAVAQSSNPSTPASGFRLFASSAGKLSFIRSDGFVRTFDAGSVSADITWTMPNVTSTVLSDSTTTTLIGSGASTPRLQIGGTSSSFPALKRSGAQIHARLADDSGYTFIYSAGGYVFDGSGTPIAGIGATDSQQRYGSAQSIKWSGTIDASQTVDTGLSRAAAKVVEVNNGTAGQAGVLLLRGQTFASLPASPIAGMHATVTDASTATWGATITGGGANVVHAFYNGSSWVVD